MVDAQPDPVDLVYTRKTRRLLGLCACLFGLIVAAGVTANLGLEDWSSRAAVVGLVVWIVVWAVVRRAALAWLARV